jgi:hypothetical protein
MSIDDFNYYRYMDNELEPYNFTQLCAKPSAAAWSLEQLYMHLISDTNFYIEQIKICVSANDFPNSLFIIRHMSVGKGLFCIIPFIFRISSFAVHFFIYIIISISCFINFFNTIVKCIHVFFNPVTS